MPQTSRFLNKIKELRLPELLGKSFLEIGSGDGVYCGFAKHIGANPVIGIESNKKNINYARTKFPNCEFLEQNLHQLPESSFDVIIMLDKLHEIKGQQEFIHALMQKLTPTGVLVLEVGVDSLNRAESKDGYPSSKLLHQFLKNYAWKIIQANKKAEGVSTYTYHISPRKPFVYLLMQPSGYGKSTIARNLFVPAGVQVVNGDRFLNMVAINKSQVSEKLTEIIQNKYSTRTLSATYNRIFKQGYGAEFIEELLRDSSNGDIALDGFIPKIYHDEVFKSCKALGYMPVLLQWDKTQESPMSRKVLQGKLLSFSHSLTHERPSPFSFIKKRVQWLRLGNK